MRRDVVPCLAAPGSDLRPPSRQTGHLIAEQFGIFEGMQIARMRILVGKIEGRCDMAGKTIRAFADRRNIVGEIAER